MNDSANIEYCAREHYNTLIQEADESRLARSTPKQDDIPLLARAINWFSQFSMTTRNISAANFSECRKFIRLPVPIAKNHKFHAK